MSLSRYDPGATIPFSWGSRVGFNRRTWNAGQTIGRWGKRWWDNRKRSAPADSRPAKRQKIQKTEIINQRAEQDGVGGSFSKFHYGTYKLNVSKSTVKELCKNYRMVNAASVLTTTAGLQQVGDFQSLFTGADIQLLSGAGAANSKVLCLGVRAETILTNAANATARITIYDIIARRDLNNATITGATTAWKQGLIDEGGAAGSYIIVGSTPFSSKSFTEYFKIRQVTHVLLAQGATHIHRVNFSPNRPMDYGTTNYGSIFKGLTCYQMIVGHGQVSDAITGGAGQSIGALKVNVVTTKEYCSTYMTDQTTTYTSSNTLPTSFTGGENLLSTGAGLVEPETNA